MRADLGAWLASGLMGLAGLALLDALGLLRRSPAGVVFALGLGYLAGVAATGLLLIALLVAGVPFTLVTFVVTAMVVALASLAAGFLRRGRRRAEPPDGPPHERADRVALAVFAGLFGIYALVGLRSALELPLDQWDAWSIWTRKALLLFQFDHLPAGVFTSEAYEFMHPDYPLLLPVLEAVGFRASGGADTQALHGQLWLLFVAGVGALAHLAARVTRPLVWAPVVLLVSVAPAALAQGVSGYADVPAGLFLALGCLSLGTWLSRGEPASLALAALMLAAAASLKNEGLVAAAAAIGVAALVTAWSRDRRRLRQVVIAGAAFVVAALPWRLWLAVQGIEGKFDLGEGLDPGFLLDRTERVGPSIDALQTQVANQDAWLYLVPLAGAVILGCLALALRRAVAVFYLATAALVFSLYVWAYWISPFELDFHLRTSVDRVAGGLVFVCVAALLQLAGELEQRVRTAA